MNEFSAPRFDFSAFLRTIKTGDRIRIHATHWRKNPPPALEATVIGKNQANLTLTVRFDEDVFEWRADQDPDTPDYQKTYENCCYGRRFELVAFSPRPRLEPDDFESPF